jgi:tetratricopeptide (TPR) repeat protein
MRIASTGEGWTRVTGIAVEPPIAEQLDGLEFAAGLEACERLLSIDGLSDQLERQARRRMAELAPHLVDLAPGTSLLPLQRLVDDGEAVVDACIAQGAGEYVLLVRARGKEGRPGRGHAYRLVALGADPISIERDESPLLAHDDRLALRTGQLLDAKPVHAGDSWWLCGRSPAESETGARLACMRLDGDRCEVALPLTHAEPVSLAGFAPVSVESGSALTVMSSIAPTVVHRLDLATRSLSPHVERSAPLIARALCPATQVIPDGEGFLTIGCETVHVENGCEQTVHRWVWFDGSWSLALVSPPFVFRGHGEERASGLVRWGDRLLVSVVDARGAALATVLATEVQPLLAPPLALGLEAVEALLEEYAVSAAAETDSAPGRTADTRRRGSAVRRRRRVPAATRADEARSATARRRERTTRVPALLQKPTIVSVTMTGSNRDIIADALRSAVDWVDWCLLIDTGITDDTIEVAREIAGDKLIVRSFPWVNDFSAARNFGLAAAAETGAEWAVILDSDERLVPNDVDIHQVLATTTEPCLLSTHSSGAYTKDRFFRLPVSGEYKGPTHEAFYRTDVFGGATVIIPKFIVDELEKTPEQFRYKRERDRAILEEYTAAHPDQQRWWYYLGDALQGLERYEEAVDAFTKCAELFTWDEESAWAMYRAAQCLIALDRLQDALQACSYGLTKHPGIAELAWLAGYITLRLQRPVHTVYWAHLAIAIGPFAGIGKSITRNGWRYQFGRWEGPYDLLRFALRDLGDVEGAEAAERQYLEAIEARKAAKGG